MTYISFFLNSERDFFEEINQIRIATTFWGTDQDLGRSGGVVARLISYETITQTSKI